MMLRCHRNDGKREIKLRNLSPKNERNSRGFQCLASIATFQHAIDAKLIP